MDKKTSIFGIILVVVGGLILLSRFEINLVQFVVPVALIIVGIWFIRKKQRQEAPLPPPPNGVYGSSGGPSVSGAPTAGGSGHPFPPPPPPPPPSGPSATMGPSGMSASMGPGGPSATMHNGGATAHPGGTPGSAGYPQYESGKVKYSKFLGDMYIECQNINMQNVEISMFVGDLQVNLRGGKLNPGLNRLIISGFMGDILVFVPQGLPVFVHCSGFVGDLDLLGRRSDGFGNTLDAQTAEYDSADAKLYVAVNNFVGDVRVYHI
jgi:predicted membrane protein